jgi:hypothetical protein
VHDAEKACSALDAGWVPIFRLREPFGTLHYRAFPPNTHYPMLRRRYL